MKNRFQIRSGCYTCRCCGKKTRETGLGESYSEMCKTCYLIAEQENNLNDGIITEKEFDEYVKEIRKA